MSTLGPLGRLGRYTATHFRAVAVAWALALLGFGFFAPRVETALSGAGWEATGSESVQARELIDRNFDGLSSSALQVVVHSDDQTLAGIPPFQDAIASAQRTLSSDPRVTRVTAPQTGPSISDGHTAVIQAGAAASSNEMVRAADDIKDRLQGAPGVQVSLTGSSGMWSDFNAANLSAMLKSEAIAMPLTMIILILAFGSLVAAGMPMLLMILALVTSAGSLFLVAQLLDVSIWAMNFAMMFAMALAIDYALFLVIRFRTEFFGSELSATDAAAETMDTAGKAVLVSGLTVLISLTAVMLVPSPAFRSMAFGIMLSVIFILAVTLTLLPAVLAKLGPRLNKLALPWLNVGEQRSTRFSGWGERIWKNPLPYGALAIIVLLALSAPVVALKTGMPSIKVVPEGDGSRVGYTQVQQAFGTGAPGTLQIVTPTGDAASVAASVGSDQGIARVAAPTSGSGSLSLIEAVPTGEPSGKAVGDAVDRLRHALPQGTVVGGAVAENHDLSTALTNKLPIVVGIVLLLSFLLLVITIRAPLLAAVGVLTNVLSTSAAFGIAKLIFQDGHLAGPLGFESQGFLNAWAPVFFFAMVFAISMDYTVFLFSAAKEHWDRAQDTKSALVGGLAQSGRVVFAAGAVMVVVFFTFALSGPLPPKEMGVILGIAVLLDAFIVRLLLIPVILRLTGIWAWWVPQSLTRLLPEFRFGNA